MTGKNAAGGDVEGEGDVLVFECDKEAKSWISWRKSKNEVCRVSILQSEEIWIEVRKRKEREVLERARVRDYVKANDSENYYVLLVEDEWWLGLMFLDVTVGRLFYYRVVKCLRGGDRQEKKKTGDVGREKWYWMSFLSSLPRPINEERNAEKLLDETDVDSYVSSSEVQEGVSDSQTKRRKVIDELLKTEADYVMALNLMREMYIIPLKYAPRFGVNILKPGEFESVTYGFEQVYKLNTEFLKELEHVRTDGLLYLHVGKIMCLFAYSMKLYIDYVNNYNNAIRIFRGYEQANSTFKAYLRACAEDPASNRRSLWDFWIMPVQRIPRYCLLLNQLLQDTPKDHCDYKNLEKAQKMFKEMAEYINSRKKDFDSLTKVSLIQERFDPKSGQNLLKDRRTFIQEGKLFLKSTIHPSDDASLSSGINNRNDTESNSENYSEHQSPSVIVVSTPSLTGKKKLKKDKYTSSSTASLLESSSSLSHGEENALEVECFLFNDIFLWASKAKHDYIVELGRYSIDQILDVQLLAPSKTSSPHIHEFFICTDNEEIYFYSHDEDTVQKWVQAIHLASRNSILAKEAELARMKRVSSKV